MSIILIIGVFEALFLILLILGKRERTWPDLYLGLILFLYALSLGGTYLELYNIRNDFPYPLFINLSWLVLFLHGPALWFYTGSLSDPGFRFRSIYLLHFIPFLFFFLIHYFNFIHLPVPEKIRLLENDLFKEQVFYKISVLSIGISTLSYNLWALKLIGRHRRNLKHHFSKIDDIDLAWLRTLILAALICYSVNVAIFNLDLIFHFASYKLLMFVAYSFASVYILFLGYFGLRQGKVFISIPDSVFQQTPDSVQRGPSRSTPVTDADFIKVLLQKMESKQPYLDPEITVSKLSEAMNVKPEFLSDVLNSQLKQNFFDFVNRYRVGEFKNQCISKASSHLSIIGIAYNCGFNSKASFYRAFKKFEGISPSTYIKSVS